MLSRVADSIYWMARYMERAENLSRLLLSTQDLLLDAGEEASDESQFWGPILMTTGDEERYDKIHATIEGDLWPIPRAPRRQSQLHPQQRPRRA
jgi:uncharacterized alpha-E superfamily protein